MKQKKIVSLRVVKAGSNPDVDSDFGTVVREKTVNHVTDVYGENNVSSIITYSSLAARGAIKQMCTIYEVPFAQANHITTLIPAPNEDEGEPTLKKMYDPDSNFYAQSADFRAATAGAEWTKVIEGARAIEGRIKTTGKHACGIIISSKPLNEIVPMAIDRKTGQKITQWTYNDLEEMGLIKFDFLFLTTVDLVMGTVQHIIDGGKTPPNMAHLVHGKMDDPQVYNMFSQGHTIGLFQFGSTMVQDFCRLMKPEEFNDLSATTALMRPGPMGVNAHVAYAHRKNDREPISSIHDDFKGGPLDDILANTYGVICYQEQILKIANEIAGFTLQEGDDLRKAMGKKKREVMKAAYPKFIKGGESKGYSHRAMERLWSTIEEFSKYGFNKCLSGRTLVALDGGGKISIADLHALQEEGKELPSILSMSEDGEIRPHRIKNVAQSGVKPLYRVRTLSGRTIRLTEDHRLLTTAGYATIKDGGLAVGTELIVDSLWTRRIAPETKVARSENMIRLNRSEGNRQQSREWFTRYQSGLTFEDRSSHQKKISAENPRRAEVALTAARERLAWLWNNDEQWQRAALRNMRESHGKLSRRGFGVPTEISNGEMADSMCEAMAAEYLLARGVDFELHRPLRNTQGRVKYTDFYVNGVYFEMDGLGRGRDYFVKEKYGDLPFVYMTPLNYKDVIDEALMVPHAENGDPIVSIEAPRVTPSGSTLREMTYDIEMEDTGPSNFVANGIISHNSHSVAYAMSAYQSAYLKIYYPVEFMSAAIEMKDDKRDEVLILLNEAARMGIKVGTPDINLSSVITAPDHSKKSGKDILLGLGQIKAVSADTAGVLVADRNANGEYSTLHDLVSRGQRAGVTVRTVYEALINSGACDSFGNTRRAMIESLEGIMKDSKKTAQRGASLFDMMGTDDSDSVVAKVSDTIPEFPWVTRCSREADAIGLFLSGHPMERMGAGRTHGDTLASLEKIGRFGEYSIVAAVTGIESKRSKRGSSRRVTITIDDGTGSIAANVDQKIVKAIDKRDAEARFLKLYTDGSDNIPPELIKRVTTPGETLEDIVKNGVYAMGITYRPASGDNLPHARVNWMEPVHLTDDGLLPVRVIVPEANKTKARSMIKRLAADHPGDYPVLLSAFPRDGLRVHRDDIELFTELADRYSAGYKDRTVPNFDYTDRSDDVLQSKRGAILTGDNPMEIMARPELFKDTGFTIAKDSEVLAELNTVTGSDHYDFGMSRREATPPQRRRKRS